MPRKKKPKIQGSYCCGANIVNVAGLPTCQKCGYRLRLDSNEFTRPTETFATKNPRGLGYRFSGEHSVPTVQDDEEDDKGEITYAPI